MSLRRPVRSEIEVRGDTRAVDLLVIEGPPGSGKTAVAAALARRLNARAVLDRAGENPFLADFYRDPERWAFKTQLFLTLSRYMQQEDLLQGDLFHDLTVTDYLFSKDRIYASLTLDDRELALYEKLAGLMEEGIPRPDLVVYLQAGADTLHERLDRREGAERRMSREYLVALVEAYNYFFLHYARSPVLVVNAARLDPAGGIWLEDLAAELRRPQAGLRYWNPAPASA